MASSSGMWAPPASWAPQAFRNYSKHVSRDSKSEFVDYQENTKTSEFFMLDACMVDASKIRSPHPQPDMDERPLAASFLPPSPAFPPNIFQIVLEPKHNAGWTNNKRTVKIDFLSQLETEPSTGAQFYYFPAAITNKLNFKMDILAHVSSNSSAPSFQNAQFSETKFESTAPGIFKASFASGDDKTFQFNSETSAVVVRLPPSDLKSTQMLVSTPKSSTRLGSDTYFAIRQPAHSISFDSKSSKNRLAIFWDASLSRSVGNRTKDQSVALQIAQKFAESVEESFVDLYLFQEKQSRRLKFRATEIATLETALRTVVYDGATRFENLHLSQKAKESTAFAVLFTDGNGLGSKSVLPSRLVASSRPVHVVAQGSERPNHFYLQNVATASGGLYIDLDYSKGMDIASTLMKSYNKCPAVTGPHKSDEIFARTLPSGHHIIVGKTASKVPFDIKIGSDNIRVEAQSEPSDLIPTLWASMLLSSLCGDSEQNRSEIIALSQEFNIPTSLTRLLLVTETSDFCSIEIPPPQGMFWGLKSYNEVMGRRDTEGNDISKPQWFFWREKAYSGSWEPQKGLMDKWDWTYRPEAKLEDAIYDETIISAEPSILDATPSTLSRSTPFSTRPDKVVKPTRIPSVAKFDLDGSYFPKGPFQCQVCPVDAKAAYLAPLDECVRDLDKIKSVYQRHLSAHKGSVAFYFDIAWAALNCSSATAEERRRFALHAIYNIFELNLMEKTHWISVAYLLEAHGFSDEALMAYEKALESQNWIVERRELALALIKFGGPSKYQRALELLELALSDYYGDDHIDYVLRVEHNALMARCKRENVPIKTNPRIADAAEKNVEADIRILLSWDSGDATIGLFVQEPDGYIVYYKDSSSPSGGFLTNTVRDGFGPEQYAIVKAVPGKYRAFARIAERDNTMTRGKLLFCRVYFNWGRATQTEQCFVIRPENDKRVIVAEFAVPAEGVKASSSITVASGGEMPHLPFIFPKWPKDGHF